ncbi:uncharacterized protein A1O9_04992 [Exophiala aquamarina CBS 119918]|uniref:Extracellular membrane protein CFEM domain-containing protein n=1 Tax=Exophiala aquamarina CBS 119918 TaxID=1182545 RepID=A0A072PK57_9EURO|nr:uncharacterized protein A1O9_04992 [Exophiala aquamarina CBS 119918]KEF60142.1 hypothetical protein A1O9_04992 [Exophiala aquamarina CBS 119918]
MRSFKTLVLTVLLTASVNAGGSGGGGDGGDYTHWLTTTCWETKSAEKEYVTVWQTQWEKPESVTLYNTLTQWETKMITVTAVETDIITTTATVYSTINKYFTDTATQTQIQVSHETATATIYSTVNNYFTDTATQTQIQVSHETATATKTATVISASVIITTEFATITDTVTEFPVCTTLVGLVTCPTRTINPTYTPPTALPTDWLWGCPPDTLCTPKQIGCNFEQNLPADTYVCSPEDCLPVKPLPPLDTSWDTHNCTPYIPPAGYANLAPPIFDLGYDIFQFNGQPGPYCPPPPSTTWQDWAPLPPPPPTSDWVAPPPPPPPVSSWADWPVSGPAGPVSSGWNHWDGNGNGDHGQGQSWRPAPPGITPRANLAERQNETPDYEVPAACFNPCNAAVLNAQSCGLKGAVLCPVSGVFSQQYTNCGNCIDVNKDKAYTEPPKLISSLVTFLDYCSGYVAEAAVSTQASTTTTSRSSSSSSSTSNSGSTSGPTSTVSPSTSNGSSSGQASSSLSIATTSSVSAAALSATLPASARTSSFTGGAALQGPSSASLLLTIFMGFMALFPFGPA